LLTISIIEKQLVEGLFSVGFVAFLAIKNFTQEKYRNKHHRKHNAEDRELLENKVGPVAADEPFGKAIKIERPVS